MKKFTDIMHFYLGCKVERTWYYASNSTTVHSKRIVEVDGSFLDDPKGTDSPNISSAFDIKPLLIPLSKISKEHLKEIFELCYQSVYDHLPFDDAIISFVEIGEDIQLTCTENIEGNTWNYTFSINTDGILFYANEITLTVSQFKIVPLLTKWYYNVFSLPESEFIDATLQNPNPYMK